ncbi:MAG: threonine synthase [Bacteroidota bacterium]
MLLSPPSSVPTRQTQSRFSYLSCSQCHKEYAKDQPIGKSPCCEKPLLAQYDHTRPLSRAELTQRPSNMWRYREMLPVQQNENIVSLGEGFTPLLPLEWIQRMWGVSSLLCKDESLNPTGSFKARGLSMAISRAKELGIRKCSIPTAGNAGGALSAYCARAGIEARVCMPEETPLLFKQEAQVYGSAFETVRGNISDCGRTLQQKEDADDWFDISTLKEPYRLEGKKTMGYEIAEQLNWELPDVIIYPTGGGTGLIGIWKAFQEMLELDWITGPLPRMIAIQAAGCAPIVEAFNHGKNFAPFWEFPETLANGLRVPAAFGDSLILEALYASGGMALAVSEEEMLAGVELLARKEGIFAAPEGGAVLMGYKRLLEENQIDPYERVVIINTGSGYKYLENVEHYLIKK